MSFRSGRSDSDSRWGDVYLAAGTRAVSVCGDVLAATTLALVLQERGHGGLAVSGLLVAASLPPAVLASIAGRVADRVDSRTILVVAGLAQFVVCLALAFTDDPIAIIGLVALLACGLAVVGPTVQALVPQMVRADDLARASGLVQTVSVVGMLIAPALAGLLVGRTGPRVPLLLDAASYLALVVAGLALRTRRRAGGGTTAVTTTAFRVRDDRTLFVLIGALAAVIGVVSAVNVFEVFLIRQTLRASATVFGLVAAAWTGGMLIGTVVFGRVPKRRITATALLVIVTLNCVPILAAAAVSNALWMIPLWIAGGVCNGATNVFLMVIVAGRVPATAHGRAFAVVAAAIQGAVMIGLLVAGPLLEQYGPRELVGTAGALGLLTGLVCLVLMRRETLPAARAVEIERDSVEK
jgi:MFS family permease